jgi:alkanesulfonate monooxygenase SsuD/methylene tetrahydromethanopterin reductase-like flavin-dependent oxidoreductase (luciferase family)
MKLGITIFATDYAMRPDDLAKACEERGFESVWFPEHTHIPTSLRTPPPIGTKVPRYSSPKSFVSQASTNEVEQT